VHRADRALGFAGIPGVRGYMIGTNIGVRYSREDFRIADGEPVRLGLRRPYVLALGCSFTFGDSCAAEDTYTHRVARLVGGTPLNTAKGGYGLAQMLILARRDIPRYLPEYVIAQYSFWLVGRGTRGFGRSRLGVVPFPYLTLDDDGSVRVNPPLFEARGFSLPFHQYDDERVGVGSYLSFLLTVALPLHVHDDLQMAGFTLRRGSGALAHPPQEPKDPRPLERAVYREIADLCRANGSQLVILRLSTHGDVYRGDPREFGTGAVVVDAQRELELRVEGKPPGEYARLFQHWRGDPPRLVDSHPNPEAHRIIARAIVRGLRQAAGGSLRQARERAARRRP